ncbi:hypothetical protein [Halanaerobaculum tunisiense]
MDMLYKDDLPFSVKVKSSWGSIKRVEDIKEINYFKTEEEGGVREIEDKVVLTEYKEFKLEFITNDDVDAVLKVENPGRLKENKLIIEPNTERTLFERENGKKYPWVPDEYLITIESNNEKYYASFVIEPNSISKKQIKKLRDMINDLVKGLIFDIRYEKRDILAVTDNCFLETELFLLDIIENELDQILKNSIDILKRPIKNLISEYQERRDKFKLDKKSVKWLASNKGDALNNSVHNPDIIYQKRNKTSVDNLENKWFIKCIFFIKKQLKNLKAKLILEIEEQNNRVEQLEDKKSKIKSELKKLNQSWNNKRFSDDISIKKGQIKGINEEINDYKKSVNIIKNRVNKANKLLKSLNFIMESNLYLENKDFMKINKPSKKLFKDRRYKKIYNVYKNIFNHKNNKINLNNKLYQFKNTEKLYEYYILINTINAFKDIGFNWEEDWLKRKIKNEFLPIEIPKGMALKFENDNYYIEVKYDKEIDVFSENKVRDKQSGFLGRKNWRPDLRVDIYSLNKDYIKSFIIEVKYRKFRNLYNNNYRTKVSNQLRNYINEIEYTTSEGELLTSPIDKIIITYPKESRSIITERYGNKFIFIQLSPEEKSEEQYGYSQFKQKIKEIILC